MGIAARSGGRVVMQRTANPRMAVRFRPGPPNNFRDLVAMTRRTLKASGPHADLTRKGHHPRT
jgi:hypothetical protein